MINKKIFVTRPSLPKFEDFIPHLKKIWKSKWLTNNGPYHQQFEKELADFLGVKYLNLFANGTTALTVALQALRVTGEVITTPFSFVATTHALWWNNIKPVFCDIEDKYYNIDPNKIESLITPKTTAILPVHVYGYPCDLEKIQSIADIYGLDIIYDAAHAFNVKIDNKPIVNFGDISILSFHATKVFTTFEGGAIICHSKKMKKRIDYLKNFGFADEETVVAPGINGKMNEFQAALGLLQLKNIENDIQKCKKISNIYKKELKNIPGLKHIEDIKNVKHNYSYFPVLVDEKKFGINRDQLYNKLKKYNIYSRKYFYPLISSFPAYRGLDSADQKNLPVANEIASRILCLPIYAELTPGKTEQIIETLKLLRNEAN